MHNETDLIPQWLNLWGEWLDSLLTTGILHIASETHQQITTWRQQAELLGFHSQQLLLNQLLDEQISTPIKSEIFYQLIQQHHLIQRLYEASLLESE